MASRFEILNPCSRKWSDLDGDGRSRYCESCKTQVHAIEEYSAEDWDRVWHASNGHVCGYLSPPPAVETRSRRAILVGALLSMVSPLMAQSGRVRIRVVDATGAVIPSAEVALLGANDKPGRSIHSDNRGEAVWADLPMGNNRFRVECPGFQNLLLTLVVQDGREIQRDAVLQLQISSFPMGTIVAGDASLEVHKSPIPSELPALPPVAKKAKRKHHFIFW